MARVPKHRRYSREEVDALLERFDRSSLTQIAFARQEDVSLSTFRWWLHRRRRQAGPGTGFLPVTIAGGDVGRGGGLELELAGGRRIHIPADIDPDALRTLLPILIAAAC